MPQNSNSDTGLYCMHRPYINISGYLSSIAMKPIIHASLCPLLSQTESDKGLALLEGLSVS
jgi:hypothetical protein